jgi:hypothetical protein
MDLLAAERRHGQISDAVILAGRDGHGDSFEVRDVREERERISAVRAGGPTLTFGDSSGQTLVFGIGNDLRLVDEHDGDSVADRITAPQTGVVDAILVVEDMQLAVVDRAGQHGEEIGIEGHVATFFG